MFKFAPGIRTKLLVIALLPSLTLLIVGVGAAGMLVRDGRDTEHWATAIQQWTAPGVEFEQALRSERKLGLLKLAGEQGISADLVNVRHAVDGKLGEMATASAVFDRLGPGVVGDQLVAMWRQVEQLPAVRSGIDAGTETISGAYAFYNQMIDVVRAALEICTRQAPDPASSVEEGVAQQIFQTEDALSRGSTLASAALRSGDWDTAELQEYARQTGYFRTELANLTPNLIASERQKLHDLMTTPAWRDFDRIDTALLEGGVAPTVSSRIDPIVLLSAADRIADALLDMWRSHLAYSHKLAVQNGSRVAHNSLIGGIAVVLLATVVLLIALRLANWMIRRLTVLRRHTQEMTDERLPAIMTRIDSGERVDLASELPAADFGRDEIGAVAGAFHRAQLAAVSAAVTEAETREGVNAVFLNIAHRSQVMAHRQLDILDRAEYQYEDPKVLDMLFRLDHLATRARRNAESLIILGGEQPRRRWRHPVPLVDLVRSAISEAEDYSRVHTTVIADVRIVGDVVADIAHLLAELVDNAAAFSPPGSRVEVSGTVVGRGAVVEIVDQGLGIPRDRLEQINATLRNPPEFALASLTSDPRLGTFVVARLAAQHDIGVRLVDSEYGGIRAIVLIPSALLADGSETATQTADSMSGWTAPAEVAAQHRSAAAQSTPLRPALPLRQRQASISPRLTDPTSAPSSRRRREQSAQQAHDMFAAIAEGTLQGRNPIRPAQGANGSEIQKGQQ
ncbi:signal transduction histidine kinase [Nocardia kruczakiae]|uniref:histidine kinase n=1 Tax=Nocardia kruczakiae TaxID=261477 RepID=A0ABU1XBF8_9NOCA|nr:nitrate- and nitrite sensing domain-containing protein [Nocardia kruczakiae]MDR7167367.1 signal transduction histidine kinase [Nocardia kruczakiae]